MLTINATDARELQKAGIPAEEYLRAAMDRIQLAIIDTARKGKSGVDVIVYNIAQDQAFDITRCLVGQEFKVTSDPAYNDKPNKVFKISWGG